MDVELIKKLKDAGYPIRYNPAQHAMLKPWGSSWNKTKPYGFIEPDIEDLIDVIGDKLDRIEFYRNEWEAGITDGDMNESWFTLSGTGPTLKEALLNYYIVLNKK